MSTILSSKPGVAYDFLLSASSAHTALGLDFPAIFDNFMTNGWVVKAPDHFIMFGLHPGNPKVWMIWWAESTVRRDMRGLLRTFFKYMPYHLPEICWARPMRGRQDFKFYSTARLLALIRE